MTKQLTKAQLAEQLSASHIAYQRMEQRALHAEAKLAEMSSAARTLVAPRQVVEAAHSAYVTALIKAKSLAMRTGRSVRVG